MSNKDLNKIGNVIRIIDDRTLIINVGKHELNIGDEIKVYESVGTLRNLDGSELCEFEYTKDTLKVIDVNEQYSVCQKQKTKVAESALSLSPLLAMSKTVYVPLDVNSDEIEPLSPKDPVIHVGDPVKKA